MWIWEYSVRIYYALKSYYEYYFKSTDKLERNNYKSNLSKGDRQKIEDMEDELIDLYEQVDIKYIYNCLSVINKDFDEKTNLIKILDFLEEESQFILINKDNLSLSLSLNKIKENTYVLELIGKFKLLDEIHQKETELNDFKKNNHNVLEHGI
jgi:hypothetical protein